MKPLRCLRIFELDSIQSAEQWELETPNAPTDSMTSKSLKRAKKKQAAAAAELAASKAISKQPVHAKGRDWARHITEAMTQGSWQQALDELRGMRAAGKVPKLGAVQRWVRLADLCGKEALAAVLLDAIMRTAGAGSTGGTAAASAAAGTGAKPTEAAAAAASEQGVEVGGGSMRRHPAWCPPGCDAGSGADAADAACSQAAVEAVARCEGRVRVVGTDVAPQMTTSNPIFMTEPGVIRFDAPASSAGATGAGGAAGPAPAPARVDVPFVDGAFVLTNVLSRQEAAQIVAVSEKLGYALDADYTFAAAGGGGATAAPGLERTGATGEGGDGAAAAEASSGSAARASFGGERAAGCVWLADDSLLGPVWERVKALLPQQLGGGKLAGLNARWRLYRYDQGTVYRPHVDGAWPGSGLCDGKVVFDHFGDRWSRLTFLFYLNDGFEGGSTTFYTPGDQEGVLEARGVRPSVGNVLVFPHGDTSESLIHEGAVVTQGVKYVIRTDVLYMLPPKPDNGRRAAATAGGAGAAKPAAAAAAKGGNLKKRR